MATQNDGEDNRAIESMVTEDLANEQVLQPLYSPATRKQWVTKLGVTANHEVVRFMKNRLSAEVMALFKETIFKQFMECPILMVYPQLLHRLMKEELRQPNPDIVKIRVAGRELEFNFDHFTIISRLPVFPKDNFELVDTISMCDGAKQFCAKYLRDVYPSIRKKDLEDVMKKIQHRNLDVDEAFNAST